MTQVPELRIALLGQGFMGKAHSNAFAQVGRFFKIPYRLRMQVICGQNPDLLQENASAWGWAETATDWRDVVSRRDIDLVDIALPNHLHAQAAIAAAEAGKIVLCEKPLANTLAEAQAMAEAARGLPTMVWFNYRRIPAIAYAKQLIDEGRIGTVFHYRGAYQQQWGADSKRPPSWRMDRSAAGAGVVGDLLSHVIDLALYLNGPIRELSAATQIFATQREVEDAAILIATFANSSLGSLEATRFGTGSRNKNMFEIQGARGALRFNLEDLNRLEFFDADDVSPLQGEKNLLITDPRHPYAGSFWRPGHTVGYEHSFVAALADFLFALPRNEEFRPNFNDGLRVQQVIAAVLQSAESQQWESL
jgi:predicted dehydrogenase